MPLALLILENVILCPVRVGYVHEFLCIPYLQVNSNVLKICRQYCTIICVEFGKKLCDSKWKFGKIICLDKFKKCLVKICLCAEVNTQTYLYYVYMWK